MKIYVVFDDTSRPLGGFANRKDAERLFNDHTNAVYIETVELYDGSVETRQWYRVVWCPQKPEPGQEDYREDDPNPRFFVVDEVAYQGRPKGYVESGWRSALGREFLDVQGWDIAHVRKVYATMRMAYESYVYKMYGIHSCPLCGSGIDVGCRDLYEGAVLTCTNEWCDHRVQWSAMLKGLRE